MTRRPRPTVVRLSIAVLLAVTNIIGTIVVFALAAWAVPLPPVPDADHVRIVNLIVAAIYLPSAMVVGAVLALVHHRHRLDWLRDSRPATDREKRALLRVPRYFFLSHLAAWLAGAVLFAVVNVSTHVGLATLVGVIVGTAGVTVASLAYLITERRMRTTVRAALDTGLPGGRRAGHVSSRALLGWLLSSGVAAVGLFLAGLMALVLDDGRINVTQLGITMMALASVIVFVGGLTTFLAARATADPIKALRNGIARVGAGRLDVELPIDDGTEIGVLQAGFNDMVHGLREREQLHDLFGRHVGVDVARAALAGGVKLGGEKRVVTVLFVDVIGSTTMATELDPGEVVTLLNRFFDVVIDVVHEHGGWINKFEGDAALAIWGAPVAVVRRNQLALAAGRALAARLQTEVPGLTAGIGISGGQVVSGNVGSADRYEYTVIGDPVNEASRLTALAKQHPERCVANASLLVDAGLEATRWVERDPITVRGREEPTRIAVPLLD